MIGPIANDGPVDFIPLIVTDRMIVTDSIVTSVDLSNGSDFDDPDERELAIQWNKTFQEVKDYHFYVSVDGGARTYLGRTGSGEKTYFRWKEGAPNIASGFTAGPQFGHRYRFFVFALREADSNLPRVAGPFTHAGPVDFLSSIVIVPDNKVIVTDDITSTVDLSNDIDYDNENERELAILWNLPYSDVNSYHVYVQIDGQPGRNYLGRTVDGNQHYLRWRADEPRLNSAYADGPGLPAHISILCLHSAQLWFSTDRWTCNTRWPGHLFRRITPQQGRGE